MSALLDLTARAFAERFLTDREALEFEPAALRQAFEAWQRSRLADVGAPGAEDIDPFAVLEEFAAASGAFGFLALQQWVANGFGDLPRGARGVGIGHLRYPSQQAPRETADGIVGSVPWVTGKDYYPELILGYLDRDGQEAYAVVRSDDPAWEWHPPMDLAAARSTLTGKATLHGLRAFRFLRRDPPGTKARGDEAGAVWQTPLMLGNLRRSVEQLRSEAWSDLYNDVRRRIDRARTGGSEEDPTALRNDVGDLAVRAARAAAVAAEGNSLLVRSPENIVYQEALLFNLMARNRLIVEDLRMRA
jgi:hypothetical protein